MNTNTAYPALRADVIAAFSTPQDEPLTDDAFNTLALRVFAHQYATNAPYRAFCTRRARTPADVRHWTDVPVVPTAAFKEVRLATEPALAVCDAGADVRGAVFRTSGTTRGAERRGEHHVIDTSIYDASLLPNFAACVLPDGARLPMLSLMPGASELPDSSLAWMIERVSAEFGTDSSACYASVDGGLRYDALCAALSTAEDGGEAVCLPGTSLAFVHLLDHLDTRRTRFRLPAGSRIMDTGGTKGSGRAFDEGTMHERYADVLGVPTSHVVNEYGMTEMCSQFYDSLLRDTVRGTVQQRRKLIPPWVRTRVVHPETLEPVPAGETGILQHFDLANLNSVMAVQTEDLGVAVADGFRLLGRSPGAPPRGCSIAMDDLLRAVAER